MQTVTIRSEAAPQKGQSHRSSGNFTTGNFSENATLTFYAYYHYNQPNQEEAKDIVFDIWVDKTGKDPQYVNNVHSGESHGNTHHRNLYIANPRSAREAFTVVVEGD
jgi:hypothetical protein